MRPKRTVLLSAIPVLLAAAATAVLLGACARKADSPETVRIGVTGAQSGLVYIADEKGFFKECGIKVATGTYEAGVQAVNALLKDSVDVATAAEFVMVQKGFDNDSLRAFAQIANTHPIEMVARRDQGIEKLSDLKGKRIGLLRGSSSEFFLGGYLKQSNISFSSVRIVNLAPPAMEEAMDNGVVDAVVIWEPFVTRIKERLGENAVSWPVQGRDDYYLLLITKAEFVRRSPALVEKLLRALIDAEGFADKHPDEAQRIIEARVNPRREVRLELAKSTLKVVSTRPS
jgi:NitT/TauT family transport system substrate-binding protein